MLESGSNNVDDAHLFRRLREDGDRSARDEIVQRYLRLAYSLAARYRHGSEPQEDLRQVAALALVKAVDRFDPELERSFATFAVPTILGELKRHFRDRGWSVHVGRATKELALRIRQARADLEADGQAATVPALAERLGADPEEILEALQASEAQVAVSYDAPRGGGDDDDGSAGSLEARLRSNEDGYDRVDDRDQIERAISGLDHRSRLALDLYYGEELSQREIAERIDVSQMQVSRILRQALEHLRRRES